MNGIRSEWGTYGVAVLPDLRDSPLLEAGVTIALRIGWAQDSSSTGTSGRPSYSDYSTCSSTYAIAESSSWKILKTLSRRTTFNNFRIRPEGLTSNI